VALLIILGQLGDFTGYDSPESNKVMKAVDTLFNLNQIDLQTLAVGIATIVLILVLAKSKISRFGLIVALGIASLMVPLFNWESVAQVADVASIPDSLPRPVLPDFSTAFALLIPAFSLAFVGLVQGAGVSQNYVNPDGKYPDASGDFIGQGVANIAAGFFQGMPVGGSLSATSLVVNSGAKSRFANIFAGITIAIALLVFGSLVSKLAMPALAGLLIVIGFQTLKPDDVKMVWKTGTVQQLAMVLTFGAALVIPLQYAVLLGVAFSVLLFVFNQSNKVTVKEWVFDRDGKRRDLPLEQDPPEVVPSEQVTVLAPFGSLFFAAAPVFEEQLPTVEADTHHAAVILNLHARSDLGSTFMGVIQRYAEQLSDHDSRLILAAVGKDARDQIKQVGLLDELGRSSVFLDSEIVGESLYEAMDEATQWLAQLPASDVVVDQQEKNMEQGIVRDGEDGNEAPPADDSEENG
jgi:SulP family sulfate permease